MPRVGLFIADAAGLGKTIEASLTLWGVLLSPPHQGRHEQRSPKLCKS